MEASLLSPYTVRFSFPLVRNFRESLEWPFNLIFHHLLWLFFLSKRFTVPFQLETVPTSARILLVSMPAFGAGKAVMPRGGSEDQVLLFG